MGNRIDNWLPPRKQPSISADDHDKHVTICGAFQVAMFLRGIERSRSKILSQARNGVEGEPSIEGEDLSALQNRGPQTN